MIIIRVKVDLYSFAGCVFLDSFAVVMKFFAVPILILLLMTQTFSKWAVVFSFRLNQDYIAKNECENRYRPVLQCNGNCVLMKKMKQEQKEEREAPGNLKIETSSVVISSRTFFTNSFDPAVAEIISYRPAQNSGIPVDRAADIFHPPLV
jgi:hypothetical protein